jgi:dCMP deaminase
MQRPSWSQWYLGIAQKIAERSVCLHRQVGAILVREHQIISAGYNGPLSGHEHCAALGGCVREGVPSGQRMELCRGTHAEQNAIDYAARFGNIVKGASLYTTHFPCSWCAKSIVQAGIVRVIYGADYPDPLAKRLLDDSGIAVQKADISV